MVQREAKGQDVAFKAFDIAAAPQPRPRRGGPYVPEGLCPTGRVLAPAGPIVLGLAFARRVGWIPRVPTFYGCKSSRVAELLGLVFRHSSSCTGEEGKGRGRGEMKEAATDLSE